MKSRSLLQRIVSLWLAVLVLTASVGLTVERHTCRFSGRSQASLALLGPAPRGCYGRLAPPKLKDSCCDFSSHLHKLSAPTNAHALEKTAVPGPLLTAWLLGPAWGPRPARPVCTGQAGMRWFAADSSPPPLGGRLLLARVCRLVV